MNSRDVTGAGLRRLRVACRWLLGAVFLYSSLDKLLAPETARTAIAFLLPDISVWALPLLVATLASAEIGLGLAFLLWRDAKVTPVVGVAFLVAVTGGYSLLRSKGFLGDCGCSTPLDGLFGPDGVLWRNMVLVAACVATWPWEREPNAALAQA